MLDGLCGEISPLMEHLKQLLYPTMPRSTAYAVRRVRQCSRLFGIEDVWRSYSSDFLGRSIRIAIGSAVLNGREHR